MILKQVFNQLLYFIPYLIIIVISYVYYAPYNDIFYNSDNAIHVLMTESFTLPRDFFYWGQNRLGSIFPMVSYLIKEVLNIHPLYACSITLYLFLLACFFIMQKAISNYMLKLALFALIFMPIGEYQALILIGHPYFSQLLSSALFILMLSYLKRVLLGVEKISLRVFFLSIGLSSLAFIFYFIGIWSSEFNLIMVIIPLLYLLFDKEIALQLKANRDNISIYLLFFYNTGLFILSLYSLKVIKSFTYSDVVYDSPFLTSYLEVKTNFFYFIQKLEVALLFKNNIYSVNTFYWFLIIVVSLLFFYFLKVVKKGLTFNFQNVLFVLSILSSLLLLFSRWNLRSEFSPRYYTPVYIMFCYGLLLTFNQPHFHSVLKKITGSLFIFFSLVFCYNHYIKLESNNSFDQNKDYIGLPEGTLFGNYWDVYKISSVAIDNIHPLPYDHLLVRNWEWREELLAQEQFYVLDNNTYPGGIKDTIRQFDVDFVFTSQTYSCQGTNVLVYKKLKTP